LALIAALTLSCGSLLGCGPDLVASGRVQAVQPLSAAPLPGTMEYVESYMQATYPSIPGDRLQYRASTFGFWDGRPWQYDSIEVQINPRQVLDIRTIEDVHRTLLNVVFKFNVRELTETYASGQLVSTQRTDELMRIFEDDGPWTESRVRDQLRRAGATFYGDEAAVAARLPRDAWRKVFGDVRLSRGTLGVSDPDFRGPNPTIGKWMFNMQASRPLNSYFEVLVEPFGGHVVRLRRTL
jgi:hypothetical protein